MPLLAKIHGVPDAGDAARERDFTVGGEDVELRSRYELLAAPIDSEAIYDPC